MISWNSIRCRNCAHAHVSTIDWKSVPCPVVDVYAWACGCANWESSDNLEYLESLVDKNQK